MRGKRRKRRLQISITPAFREAEVGDTTLMLTSMRQISFFLLVSFKYFLRNRSLLHKEIYIYCLKQAIRLNCR